MFKSMVLLAAMAAAVQATPLTQCTDNSGPYPDFVVVQWCSRPPCPVQQTQDAVFDVIFTAPRPLFAPNTQATVYLTIAGMVIPIPVDLGSEADTCGGLRDASCPLRQGQQVHYRLKIPIEPFFPHGTRLRLELLVQEDGSPAFCFSVNVLVISPYFRLQ